MKVYKYKIEPNDYVEISIPRDSHILTVQAQFEDVYLWALVNPQNGNISRRFRLVGTGHSISEDPRNLGYIGTFQLLKGAFVFHLFEIKED